MPSFQTRVIQDTEETHLLTRQPGRTALGLYNNHVTATLYFRESKGVDVTNGFPLPAGASIFFKIPEDDTTGQIFIISDTADTDLRFMESFGLVPRSWIR